MKKSLSIAAVAFCLLVALVFAMSFDKEQKEDFKVCKKGCLNASKSALESCNTGQKNCLDTCKNDSASCNNNLTLQKQACFDSCQLAFNVSINQSLNQSEIKKITNELRLCKRECTLDANEAKKRCKQTHCRNECDTQKKLCVIERNDARLACFESCVDVALNDTPVPPINDTAPINQTTPNGNESEDDKGNNSNACNHSQNPPFCAD